MIINPFRYYWPPSLFAAGEQGAWYDPAEFSTLFQDSAGTTPVTAVEQAVGLMLDKSKGLVSAAVTVTNGGFDADSDWTKGTGWSIGSGVATKSAGTAANLTQTIATTTGQWYRVTATLTRTAGGITVSLGTSGTTSGSVTAAGTYTWYILAGSSTQTLTFAADASFAGTVDNVSVNSVSGNHAYQSTSTSRPTLRSRVNLLTKTEDFTDGTAWPVASRVGIDSITANQAVAPNGEMTADLVIESTATSGHSFKYTTIPTGTINVRHQWSLYVKRASGTRNVRLYNFGFNGGSALFDLSNGTASFQSGTSPTGSISSVGNGWWKITFEDVLTNTNQGIAIALFNGTTESYAGDGTSGIYVWGASLVTADQVSLPYQRVNTATDYDTAGFPVYLDFCESFGGTNTDNSMLTNSIDFSGTDKMTVFAGVRKLSDAAQSVVAELSATIASNNGTFLLSAPNSAAANYNFSSKGTTLVDNTVTTYTAPITSVIAATGNISAPSNVIRINGSQAGSQTGSQGTGNYGNFAMYIGRRNNASLPASMRLYSLIVRGATTSDAQIAAIETWVNSRARAY